MRSQTGLGEAPEAGSDGCLVVAARRAAGPRRRHTTVRDGEADNARGNAIPLATTAYSSDEYGGATNTSRSDWQGDSS